jgi:hypothetical protein
LFSRICTASLLVKTQNWKKMPPVITEYGRVVNAFLIAKRYHEENIHKVSNIQAYKSQIFLFE